MRGIGAEVRQRAGIEPGLAVRAGREQRAAFALEAAVQVGEEGARGRRQQGVLPAGAAGDFDSIPGVPPRGLLQHCRHRRLRFPAWSQTMR